MAARAVLAVHQRRRLNADADFQLLLEELSQLQFRIQFEARVQRAEKNWADCMRTAGVSGVDGVYEGSVVISNKWDEVAGNVEGDDARSPDPEAHADIQSYEIEMAVADLNCSREHFDEVFTSVVRELEAQFVEQHVECWRRFATDWPLSADYLDRPG